LPKSTPSTATTFDFWDEDEFEGLPTEQHPDLHVLITDLKSIDNTNTTPSQDQNFKPQSRSFTVGILCESFLIMFAINYFTGNYVRNQSVRR
ncbi:hypothetical protein A2U01_0003953, partial [Trifolium medium]|nr:hypothetical protein [Trifolium medium]